MVEGARRPSLRDRFFRKKPKQQPVVYDYPSHGYELRRELAELVNRSGAIRGDGVAVPLVDEVVVRPKESPRD